jgi:hypothetical protein
MSEDSNICKKLSLHQMVLEQPCIDVKLIDVLREGLQADGAHHKQWALWRIAEIMGMTHLLSDIEDRGIAP